MLFTRSYSLQIKQKLHAAQMVYQNSKKKKIWSKKVSSFQKPKTKNHKFQVSMLFTRSYSLQINKRLYEAQLYQNSETRERYKYSSIKHM